MQQALALAKKGQGHVSPNPMVGCVIVKNNRILAEGYHKKYGFSHAEINTLRKLKNRAKGATMYVTLEPCFHEGKTPPCVDAVIASRVRRVVIAMKDPNPLTSGKSIRRLKAKGISVNVGVCAKEAKALNRFFRKHITTGLPYVIAKVAQSLDGKIAARQGEQTWLTGKKARAYVQDLRKTVDAILVGRRTVEIDQPALNVRGKGSPQPIRVVLDSKGRLLRKKKIFLKEGGPVILAKINSIGTAKKYRDPRGGSIVGAIPRNRPTEGRKHGFAPTLKNSVRQKDGSVLRLKLARTPRGDIFQQFHIKFFKNSISILPCRRGFRGQVSLTDLLKKLGRLGISSVLVEGGSQVFTSFFKEGLVDEWQFFIAPKRLGSKAVPTFSKGRGPDLRKAKTSQIGKDILKVIR